MYLIDTVQSRSAQTMHLPIIFPTQYPIRYNAATVVFFVYPATLDETRESKATNGVGLACVI